MICSNYLLFILLLTINNILPVKTQNIPFHYFFNQFGKIPSVINGTHDAVERFQCPNGWERFGGSCYFFPSTKSMPNRTSQICSHYSNNSQLMKIRHLSEIYYAAYSLKIHDRKGLILEIDPKLLKGKNNFDVLSTNDWFQWQQANEKFRQTRDGFYHQKMKTSNQFSYVNESASFTLTSTDLTTMRTGNYQDFEQVSKLVRTCDKILWNADKNDSHMFLLIIYVNSKKTVCSVNDIEPNELSQFMCQYVLDYCLANDECGMFRRCINTLTGPKCSCYLPLFRDFNCRSISGSTTQLIIVAVIIIILQSYICREGLKTLGSGIKYILTCCKDDEDTTENGQNNVSVTDDDWEEGTRFGCWLFGISILLLLVIIPIVYRPSLLRLNLTDQLDMSVLANDFKQMVAQCKRYPISQGIIIVSGVSIFFIVCLSLLINQRRKSDDFCNVLTEFLIPFKSFELTNRYETAAVFGIVVFEVLTTLNCMLFDFTEFLGPGVLTKVIQSLWNLFIVIIKYYPVFVSLRQNNVIMNSFAVVYYMVTLVFIIGDKKSCWNLFPPSERVSDIAEAKLYIMYGKWIVGFGLFLNILYFILLAYIGAEITARFLNALKRLVSKEVGVFTIILSNKTCDNVKRKPCCSCLRSVFNYFYPWDDKFQFITISLCTYIGALIFVHFLTCTLTIHGLMGRSTYINILTGVVESMLIIKIQDFSLWWEIILSGSITMIFFSYQLLTGMKNCKKNAKSPSQNITENDSSTSSITSESIDYLKLCIPCMAGGVYIFFPLVLFILIIVGRISTQFVTVEQFLSFILPPLLLYILQTSIMSLSDTFSPKHSKENIRTVPNKKINIVNVIFITSVFIGNFHIGIAACVFRLLKNSLDNIISGTQIDCSKLGQPAEVPRCLCIEHETNNDTTRNSKDEDAEEDTQSLAPDQPCDSAKASSIYDDHQHEELIHDISLSIPLSPDVKPQENRPFFQPRRSADTTTSSKQNPTTNPSNSSRNRGEKRDADPNSQQRQSLLSQDFKLSLEDDSEDRQYSFRRTTAV